MQERLSRQLKRYNEGLPIHTLPPELLVAIFNHVDDLEDWYHMSRDYNSRLPVFPETCGKWRLRRVCWRWNETIVETPLLWTNYFLANSKRNRKLALSYSGDAPLRAHFAELINILPFTEEKVRSILKTMPRWRTFRAYSETFSPLPLGASYVLNGEDLPALEILEITGPLPSQPSSPFTRLTQFTWTAWRDVRAADLDDFLAQLPSLESLSLILQRILGYEGDSNADGHSHNRKEALRFRDLPRLRKLRLESDYSDEIWSTLTGITAAAPLLDSVRIYQGLDSLCTWGLKFQHEEAHVTSNWIAPTLSIDRGRRLFMRLKLPPKSQGREWMKCGPSDTLPLLFGYPGTTFTLETAQEPGGSPLLLSYFPNLTYVRLELFYPWHPQVDFEQNPQDLNSFLKELTESSTLQPDPKDWLCPNLKGLKFSYVRFGSDFLKGELDRMKTLIRARDGAVEVRVDRSLRDVCPSQDLVQDEEALEWYRVIL